MNNFSVNSLKTPKINTPGLWDLFPPELGARGQREFLLNKHINYSQSNVYKHLPVFLIPREYLFGQLCLVREQ